MVCESKDSSSTSCPYLIPLSSPSSLLLHFITQCLCIGLVSSSIFFFLSTLSSIPANRTIKTSRVALANHLSPGPHVQHIHLQLSPLPFYRRFLAELFSSICGHWKWLLRNQRVPEQIQQRLGPCSSQQETRNRVKDIRECYMVYTGCSCCFLFTCEM